MGKWVKTAQYAWSALQYGYTSAVYSGAGPVQVHVQGGIGPYRAIQGHTGHNQGHNQD